MSFDSLIKAVCQAPVLHIIDYTTDAPLELHTDASGKALGGVLYQRVSDNNGRSVLKPVAFHSRNFKSAE